MRDADRNIGAETLAPILEQSDTLLVYLTTVLDKWEAVFAAIKTPYGGKSIAFPPEQQALLAALLPRLVQLTETDPSTVLQSITDIETELKALVNT